MLGKSRGTEPIRGEVCPRTGGVIQKTSSREMNDAKCFSLSERQLFELAFSWVGFRLAVRRARLLIVRMYRAGGPLAQAIISERRAHELHRANGEEEKKKTVPGTKHDALPLGKSGHRTMRDTPSAIHSSPGRHRAEVADRARIFQHSHAHMPFHTGGIPSRPASNPPLQWIFRVAEGCVRSVK